MVAHVFPGLGGGHCSCHSCPLWGFEGFYRDKDIPDRVVPTMCDWIEFFTRTGCGSLDSGPVPPQSGGLQPYVG